MDKLVQFCFGTFSFGGEHSIRPKHTQSERANSIELLKVLAYNDFCYIGTVYITCIYIYNIYIYLLETKHILCNEPNYYVLCSHSGFSELFVMSLGIFAIGT